MKQLDDSGAEGIIKKVKNTVDAIISTYLFGGTDEGEDIVKSTHFFIVYSGMNNVVTKGPCTKLGRHKSSKDSNHRQKSAVRNCLTKSSDENAIYNRFGEKLIKMGLSSCSEEIFPGAKSPKIQPYKGMRVRQFSVFSANDFCKLINSGYYDAWNWGPYIHENSFSADNYNSKTEDQ